MNDLGTLYEIIQLCIEKLGLENQTVQGIIKMRVSRFWNRIGVFILIIKGGGEARRPYVAYFPGHDLIEAPSLGKVGLSYNYYD